MSILKESIASKTILIVDDRTNNLHVLAEYLDRANYKTLIAIDGTRAISIAKRLLPDLILLDIMMPEVDGFTVCNSLKSDRSTKDIPIIFMSALHETNLKIKGLELGAVDYITKPFEKAELLTRVKTHLALSDLYQASLRNGERRRIMLSIADRIRKSLELKTILNTATDEIANFLDCDFVGIASVENKQVSLQTYRSTQNINLQPQTSIPYEYFCPTQDICQSYCQGKIKLVDPSNQAKPLPETQQRLIIPIEIDNTDYKCEFFSVCQNKIVTGRCLYGWLIVDLNSSTRNWQSHEIDFLQEISIHLAIGIKQGLLHQQLLELALLDSLTCIYNRRYFDRQLEQEWRRLRRIGSPLSLIMCDIDYFKIYNDSYGHQEGDRCLQQVTQAISDTLKRPGDILARYGGEEFAIILPQTPQQGAIKVAENIKKTIKKLAIPHKNSLVDSLVTLSLGVATTIPNSEDNPELFIEAADLALYKAKDSGRNCVAVFPESIALAKNREKLKIHWVRRLRNALEKNLFSLYAQSIVPLKENNNCRHFEILLRLTDEDNKVVSPGDFLDIAESNFLMTDIDIWVINNLFAILEKFDRHTWNGHSFSINLSGSSLNNQLFLKFLQQKLNKCSLPPEIFCFEITESVAISNLTKIVDFIHSLKKIGCKFALDDFGKGVSSLNYLKNLPVDYLKIDGSFIKEVNINPTSKIMVEAINHIAEGVGLKTVAEFVENEHILNSVKDLNVDFAQGFHFSRPKVLMEAIC